MDSKKKKLLEDTYERIINVGLCIIPYEDLSDLAAPELMFFGTTKDEKVFSFSELDAMFKSQYEQMAGFVNSLDRKRLFTRTSNDGKNAFITEEVTLTMTSPEEVNTIFMRCSCVMEYIDNQWKLTHLHASTPVDTENDHWHMEEWKREKEKLQKLVDQQTADLHLKNRELEIEAALERVRAAGMAMHHSEDLAEASTILFEQLADLGLEARRVGFALPDDEKQEITIWSTVRSDDGKASLLSAFLYYDQHPIYPKMIESWRTGKKTFSFELHGLDLQNYYKSWNKTFKTPKALSKTLKENRSEYYQFASFDQGMIYVFTANPLSEEQHQLLVRFANAFELTYTRFLDLQKAEAQAREAEIQLALERVRARTMAMQSSDEFADVAAVLFDQVRTLGGNLWGTGFGLCEENADNDEFWFANENGVFPAVSIPNTEDPAHKQMYEGWKSKAEFLALEGSGKDLKNHYEYMMTLPEVRPFFQKILDEGLTFPEWQQWNAAYFSHGYLLIITLEPYSNQEILKRFARVFDQTYTRFLDLKKAEKQARESEIQLALERVRARSMAMHKSDELADLSLELVKQVHALGIDTWFCAFNIYDDHPDGSIEWGSNGQGTFPRYRTPREGVFLDYYEAGQRGETLLINEIGEDECPAHYNYLCSLPGVGEQLLQMKDTGIPFPTYQIDHVAFFKYGYILFITFEPVPEAHDIFKRFAKVFQQTYTRFMDLQKAESQAREAKIEAALERVRARSMGMHKSDDLIDVVREIGKGIHELGIQLHYSQIFTDYTYDPKTGLNIWVDVEGQDYLEKFHLPYIDHTITLNFYNALNEGLDYFSDSYSKAEKNSYFKLLFKYSDLKRIPKKRKELILNASGWTRFTVILNEATLNFGRYSLDEFTDEEHEIFIRFAKVFGQAYTRFLDLKKAEEQAREAKIEAALERVRARSMGMHKSDNLIDVVREIGKGIHELGIQLHHSQIYTDYDYTYGPKTDVNIWVDVEGQDYLEKFHLPYIDHIITLTFYNALKEGLDYFSDSYSKAEKNSYFKLLFKYSDLKKIPKKRKELVLNASGWTRFSVILNEASLNFGRYSLDEFSDEEQEIFIRFAKVFGQAYTRFLDLKKAEEQAREAQIEAALERVRSRSLAMQKTNELQDVVRVVAEELKNTGVILDTGGAVICTYFQDSRDVIHWTATDDPAHPSVPYLLPYFEDELFDEAWESKSRGDDYFAKVFSYDVKNAFFSHAFKHSDYRQLPDEYKKIILESKSHGIAWAWAENSAIMIPSIQGDLPSEDEKKILVRFAKVFEQSFIRFLDLQKAEAQAREAKIEAALEKVRSRTMGMQSSDELPEVANMLFLEVQGLGIPAWSSGFNILAEDKRSAAAWMSSEGTLQDPFTLRLYGEASFDEMGDFLRRNEPFMVQELGDEALQEHYKYMKTFPDLKPTFKKLEEQGLSLPSYQINHLCKFSHGFLLFITYEPVPEAHDIFKRFTRVFDQTYTRFLDLKKAEKQARESRIEAALERVRSRAMAMQTSDELKDVALELRTQMGLLGQKDLEVCAIHLYDLHQDYFESWGAMHPPDSEDEILQSMALFPKSGSLIIEEMMDYYASDQSDYVLVNEGEKFKQWFELMKEHAPEIYRHLSKANADTPEDKLRAFWAMSEFSGGALIMVTYSYPDEDSRNLLRRTANVFGLAYKRFNDLKRAEEQAREAQIENALEKVRSRSLAMQTPDELVEVAQLLREEMGALGVEELETSSIYIHDDTGGLTQCWFTIKDSDNPGKSVTDQMTIDLQDTWVGRQMNQFYDSGQDSTSILMKGDHRIEWIRYCEDKSDLFGTSEFYGETIPERIYHLYKFSNGFLGAASPGEISDESWDLMRRATGVFSFAYTRFRDLQKAEESARRARQQASLDRVRADISSMRSAEDLDRVTPLIWNELTTLGIPFIRCGVFIMHEDEEQIEVYLSKPDGTSLAVMHLGFDSNELTARSVNAWQKGSVYKQHWTQEEFLEWGQSMMEQGQVTDLESYQGAEEAPESLHLQFLPFNQGMLYVGSTNPLDEEEISLSESLAKAFSIAYARYEDFVKLEKAKAGIEEALAELKATQSQLVQQEKLASLGQLTAGIAHEIKNPLNFVNNFSEVSLELLEEAREEVKNSPLSRGEAGSSPHNDLILEILDDIEANLRKIHEHGSRADSIVKSMLEHSRGGSGKMEPTKLNALVKEFVNLTFHGMRASKNPINVDLDFQLDESIGEVPLIAEDFSRVIINLCNNTFDAMREKQSSEFRILNSEEYKPRITIRTQHIDSGISLEIEDNGPGIPEEMKDKILQPFFTTKKGTEGTGLGLSITNDIIKAHGGGLSVNSTSGSGSTFIITLKL